MKRNQFKQHVVAVILVLAMSVCLLPAAALAASDRAPAVTQGVCQNKMATKGENTIESYRQQALSALADQFAKYKQSDYSAENWEKLVAAYELGQTKINAAEPAGAPYIENNVIAALNAAIAAMQSIPADHSGKITVCVSMDADTLGLGYLIKPTLVSVDDRSKASVVITDLLEANGYTYDKTGKIEDGFYLAGVSDVDQTEAVIAPYIKKAIEENNGDIYDDSSDLQLSEFDYTYMSGWMYSVGTTQKAPSFPGVGASAWQLSDGEVMRWQFTVWGYGADLNADNSAWGTASINPDAGDKSSLSWEVASLRQTYGDEKLEGEKIYDAAMEVLTEPTANQTQIDTALAALKLRYTPVAFDDVATNKWYAQAVTYVVQHGLMQGVDTQCFAPDDTLDRAMLVTMLYRLAGSPAVTAASTFADVEAGKWYTNAVAWAQEVGITSGVGKDLFAPQTPVTRQQIAKFLFNYSTYYTTLDTSARSDLQAYSDVAAISGWAKEAIQWANAKELIKGRSATVLAPNDTATRAEAAEILMRFCQAYNL